jgi:hypothetical protein
MHNEDDFAPVIIIHYNRSVLLTYVQKDVHWWFELGDYRR